MKNSPEGQNRSEMAKKKRISKLGIDCGTWRTQKKEWRKINRASGICEHHLAHTEAGKKMVKEIKAENFPNLKNSNPHIQEALRILSIK